MKTLKGLDWPERQRRHRLIMESFQLHEAKNLPWMARTSANDPDVVMDITNKICEPVGVYSWTGKGNWISVSINQVSESVNGRYSFFEFGKNQIKNVSYNNGYLYINEINFICPADLAEIYAKLIQDMEKSATHYAGSNSSTI